MSQAFQKHFLCHKLCQTAFCVPSLTKPFSMSQVLQNGFPCDRPYKIIFRVKLCQTAFHVASLKKVSSMSPVLQSCFHVASLTKAFFMSQVLPNCFSCHEPYKTAFHVTSLQLQKYFSCHKLYKNTFHITGSAKPLFMPYAIIFHFISSTKLLSM